MDGDGLVHRSVNVSLLASMLRAFTIIADGGRANRSSEPRWSVRDWLAGRLFAATASVILWQNAHVAVLWDISYTLDSATRIAAGQIPYRDFPFVHPPLTFLIQAAIMRLTGRVYFHHVLLAAVLAA